MLKHIPRTGKGVMPDVLRRLAAPDPDANLDTLAALDESDLPVPVGSAGEISHRWQDPIIEELVPENGCVLDLAAAMASSSPA